MASRYIPPALRKQAEGGSSGVAPTPEHSAVRDTEASNRFTVQEIHHHYWPDSPNPRTETDHATDKHKQSTLNSSADLPAGLSYVVLHRDANPRWEPDRIIFVKSNLDLLPGSSKAESHESKDNEDTSSTTADSTDAPISDSKPATDPTSTLSDPVAVFNYVTATHFTFAGYYRIAKLDFLEPSSEGLKRMLVQKWSRPDRFGRMQERPRNPEAWAESLRHRWAVIKFERNEAWEQEKGVPRIEKSEPESKGQRVARGVNELLRKMRLGESEGWGRHRGQENKEIEKVEGGEEEGIKRDVLTGNSDHVHGKE